MHTHKIYIIHKLFSVINTKNHNGNLCKENKKKNILTSHSKALSFHYSYNASTTVGSCKTEKEQHTFFKHKRKLAKRQKKKILTHG